MHTIYDLNNTMRSFSVSSLLFFSLVCESVCVYWLSCVGLKLTMTSMRPKHAMQTRGCAFFLANICSRFHLQTLFHGTDGLYTCHTTNIMRNVTSGTIFCSHMRINVYCRCIYPKQNSTHQTDTQTHRRMRRKKRQLKRNALYYWGIILTHKE